ncbi:MAG: CinA family protein [Halobacteria archaeon]
MDTEYLDVSESIGNHLRDTEESLATAESCTGGLVASMVTDVPGSSDYFDRGAVTYSYRAKNQVLGVDQEWLDNEGAVNARVATEMATGVLEFGDVDWGVSTTGVAGPGGGGEDVAVGEVYFGFAYASEKKLMDVGQDDFGSVELSDSGDGTVVHRRVFDGGRREVKRKAAVYALERLEELLCCF